MTTCRYQCAMRAVIRLQMCSHPQNTMNFALKPEGHDVEKNRIAQQKDGITDSDVNGTI